MIDSGFARAAEAFIDGRASISSSVQRAEFAARRARLRREDLEHVRTAISAGGFDLKQLDALAAGRERAHRALAEEEHQRAVDASEEASRLLRALTPERVAPTGPQEVILDQVLFIRGFAGYGTISDSGTYPGDNWAQYHTDDWSDGRLSFFTLWHNSQNRTVFASAAARLMVNAHLSAYAEGSGIFIVLIDNPTSKATVSARTKLYSMWDPSASVEGEAAEVGKVSATAGFSSDSDSKSIRFNELLPAPSIAVPKQGYVLIEVELLMEHHGEVHFDAESGAFRVDQPTITLTLTT